MTLGLDAVDQEERALGAAEQLQDGATLFPGERRAEFEAALTGRQQEFVGFLRRVRRRGSRTDGRRQDGLHRPGEVIERGVDETAAGGREPVALDTTCDLVERLAEARREIFFLHQA